MTETKKRNFTHLLTGLENNQVNELITKLESKKFQKLLTKQELQYQFMFGLNEILKSNERKIFEVYTNSNLSFQ